MKRTTKRAISFLLALCMILALAGCGKKRPRPQRGQFHPNARHDHTGACYPGTCAGAGGCGGSRGHEVGL